jgi:putative hydrolase of the HAD superfamily
MNEKTGTFALRAVVFDFGGVLAEEGFVLGLKRIGQEFGIGEKRALDAGERLVQSSGYVRGQASEAEFWEAFRAETGISAQDRILRKAILDGFTLRPRMLDLAEWLRKRGLKVAILSDQTDWLEALNRKTPFLWRFDLVHSSFRTGRTKADDQTYIRLLADLGLQGPEVLFVDDRPSNLARAARFGIRIVLCEDPETAEAEIRSRVSNL